MYTTNERLFQNRQNQLDIMVYENVVNWLYNHDNRLSVGLQLKE